MLVARNVRGGFFRRPTVPAWTRAANGRPLSSTTRIRGAGAHSGQQPPQADAQELQRRAKCCARQRRQTARRAAPVAQVYDLSLPTPRRSTRPSSTTGTSHTTSSASRRSSARTCSRSAADRRAAAHMLMRVACGIHCGTWTPPSNYELMSRKLFTHARPRSSTRHAAPSSRRASC